MKLPNLENFTFDSKQLEIEERREKALSIFLEENSGNRASSVVGVIPSEMLFEAPKDFFKKYDEVVEKVTRAVRDNLTQSNRAKYISAANEDPTNEDLKGEAQYAIMNELLSSRIEKLIIVDTLEERDLVYALVANEIIGLGPLEPLWQDPRVTEIICNGPHDIQVEIEGRIIRVPGARFRDRDHLESLVSRLYSSVGKDVSATRPMEVARLHDKSRMHVVMPPVAPEGPNFNIRKHSESFWTPDDIIRMGTSSVELMTYIGNMINAGASIVVIGGTGTGKTTLLNALTSFFPEDDRIVTLEKSLEMKPHPRKLFAAAMETRPGRAGSVNEHGITMRDLVEAAMIMRPDGIVIGEVIDGAAYDLCQALNTGHWGASTIHADDAEAAITRLKSLVSQEELIKGDATLELIAAAFDLIIVVNRFDDGSRKISEVHEVARHPERNQDGELVLNTIPLWEFVADDINYDNYEEGDEIKVTGDWIQLNELSDVRKRKLRLNLKKELTWPELQKLASLEKREGEY